MKGIIFALEIFTYLFIFVTPTFSLSTPQEISSYTNNTFSLIIAISFAATVFFLVKGGYEYITSSGKPNSIENAKKTIKNSLIGLTIVLTAGFIVPILNGSFGSVSNNTNVSNINITSIQTIQPPSGLTAVLTDAISGVLQLVITSAAKPIMNGIISFLSNTPTLLDNSVIMNYWLIMVSITDSLFVVVIALLGLHFISSENLGFEQIELKHLLPRIGLAFLGANVSLFLANYAILTCNALVNAVLNSTGGLNQTLLLNVVDPVSKITLSTPFISLIFYLIFLIVLIVLLFMYIGRLIFISLGAVLSPFIFLLWCLPKFSDFAEIAIKTYLIAVFTIFIQVVIIQLASAFILVPSDTNNSLITVAVGIGLFLSLLKTPQLLMNLVFYTSGIRSLTKLGGHLINAITTDKMPSSPYRNENSGSINK